jgi:hypothetical protein
VLIVRSDPGDTQIYAAPPVLTGAEILVELLTVDGAGSGLDADLLDGQSSAHYATAASVTAEASARAAADTALDGRLDALEADPTTATALAAEASTRAAADTALDARLDALEADPTTATALAAEASTRAAADTALDARLDVIEADTSLADHEAETTTAHGIPAQIAAAIAALVDTAPGTLDTLNELAAALGDDPNFAATMTAALAGKQPLDSDLTAIAALSTTPFGRALLELVDAAAGRSALALGTMATQAATAYAALTGATFTGAVALPATAPGVNGATRVTAVDAATGTFAVNGAVLGDTGARDIGSLFANGWIPSYVGSEIGPNVSRFGNVVSLTLNVNNGGTAPTLGTMLTLPDGYRPARRITGQLLLSATSAHVARLEITTSGAVTITPHAALTGIYVAHMTWVTHQPAPAVLPGAPITTPFAAS